ncbi:hypothetical protein E2I00_018289, partial [Balaenoptera physalus]
AISISKAINTQEAPVKEKHARRILPAARRPPSLGAPGEAGSFCHVLHKVLRDGHPNVLHDCQRYRSNIREIGDLWGHLHDRYGQLVNIYTKLLLTKISFHLKHPEFPAGLEVTDEVLEKAAGTDVNNILRNFFRRASDMLYFKRLIQIPRLPEGPPNFLRASALAEHIKPVVVIPEEAPEDEEPESLIEIGTGPPAAEPAVSCPLLAGGTGGGWASLLAWGSGGGGHRALPWQVVADLFEQTFGPPNGSMKDDRLDALSAEKDTLSSVVRQRQAELVAAQSLVREKEEALSWEQQRSSRERDELQERLADKFAMLRGTAAEAERILQDAVGKLDDPLHLRCTSSPGLMDTCRECGARALELVGQLQDQRALLQAQPGLELKPKSLDVRQEELGAMVDKEMAATSAAIEDAVRRIEPPCEGQTASAGQRILNSCTDLMKGAATQQEFYAKNSRWTEGLISASKAVGWGATQLVYVAPGRGAAGESADKVVLHTGKYEELIVCSHEIAASTAQLVAASKVRVLELEKTLEVERVRLGELRKQHYMLAGA